MAVVYSDPLRHKRPHNKKKILPETSYSKAKKMIKSILTATALIAALTPAAAADNREEFEITIIYDATLLATESGSQALTRLIKEHARDACTLDFGGPRAQRVDTACVEDLVDATLAKINQQSKNG
jgi:UrcA family protein